MARTTRIYGGTGLGLSISRRLARLLGGDLGVAGRAADGGLAGSAAAGDTGSAFTLLVPLIASAAPDDAPRLLPDDAGLDRIGGGARVLIADDDPANRWVAKRMVELLGFQADVVEDGEMALRALRSCEHALLITDCHMPRMDGVALTEAVRRSPDPVLRALPIIGLTADVTGEQRDRCDAAGMTAVVIKPLTIDGMSRLLSRHLRGPAGNPATGPEDGTGAHGEPGATVASHGPGATGVPHGPAQFDDETWRALFTTGDPGGEAWLLDYLDTAEKLDDALCGLLADGCREPAQRDAIVDLAHRFAGSSLSVGAIATGEAARALEQAAVTEDVATLRTLHGIAAAELAAAQIAMARFLAHIQSELTA